jgi:alcohol dehydrogenase
VVAIPTTAGTGAEVTPFATVWDRASVRKNSFAHDLMPPLHAVLDPELTLTLPRDETLFGGLDTLSHALESLWNRGRSPLSEMFSLRALDLATDALESVLEDPEDIRQRERMQQASLLAGMAISQTRTAVAHAISYPLTLRYGVPHGLACGFTLGPLIDAVSDHTACEPFARQMRAARALLGRLALEGEIARRVSLEQALAVIDEMVAPGRTENFVLDLTRHDIEALLCNSFGSAA